MAMPIVYVDRSDVRPGALSDLRAAVSELVAFVEAREPQLLSYGFYVDDDSLTMTVVAVHPDSASLEYHLNIGGPEFRKVGAYITLRSIEVFGEASESALDQLREKARALGDATVVVRAPDAGFARPMPTDRA
jgi:quinol monooxygenase YgiN